MGHRAAEEWNPGATSADFVVANFYEAREKALRNTVNWKACNDKAKRAYNKSKEGDRGEGE